MGQIRIDFYTDPLDCWSYAFQPHWRKLLSAYQQEIDFHYVLCGMIPDWNSYSDPMNSVFKPIQMGPVWMHASEVTHVKMDYSIWHKDPPSSSYPACMAIKTAGLQSKQAEDVMLQAVGEALMSDGLNISKAENLLSVASKIQTPAFDFDQFKNDWQAKKGIPAFRKDIEKAKIHSVGRYPTLTFQNCFGQGIIIVGYRPYEVLEQAFLQFRGAVNEPFEGLEP